MARTFLGVLACLAVLVPGLTQAQWRRLSARVAPPPASITAPDDALGVEVNPAALPFLGAWGLTYVHTDAQGTDRLVERGDAVYVGVPLPLDLGFGFSAESLRPTAAIGEGNRGGFSLALAGAPGDGFGLGVAVRYMRASAFASTLTSTQGLTSIDLSSSWRPTSRFAMSLQARDLNALVDLTGVPVHVATTFLLAAAVRPYGTDSFTLEAAAAVDSDGLFGVRGMVGIALPKIGRASFIAEVDDVLDAGPDLRLMGGIEIDWGALGVGGGLVGGDGFGDVPGWYVSAHLRGSHARGLPTPSYVLDLPIRSAMGERTMVSAVARLDQALHDDRVAGVFIRLRDTDMGLAYAQELRLMIDALRKAGKPVLCHLETATGSEYYACAGASRVLLDPAGSVRLMGPSGTAILLGGALRRIGVRADFVRIGRYKSAVEQYMNERSSEGAREQRSAMYDDVYARLAADLARDLDRSVDAAKSVIDEGPFAAAEAVEVGLVQAVADELDMTEEAKDVFGSSVRLGDGSTPDRPRRWGSADRIGMVVVDGTMVDGDNTDLPILEIHNSGGRTVSRAIEKLAADRSVKAIVLRVDSPGGSAVAADQIWRAVRRAREKKPVVVSMGKVAASAGYYIASAADEIIANPATLTGSIGIFFGKVDVVQLAEMLSVTLEPESRGRHAGADSIYRPFTPEERSLLADKIRIWYRLFLQRVAEGRGMEPEDVHRVGQGRVWSGDSAVGIGLVDRLGGLGTAIARARELAGLDDDAQVVVLPKRPSGLLDYVLGTDPLEMASTQTEHPRAVLPAALRQAAGMALAVGDAGALRPLALMPAVVKVD